MRHRQEDRLRTEIDEHLNLQTEENIRAGMSPANARRQALLACYVPARRATSVDPMVALRFE